jgi:hypothetical protein
MNEWLHQHLTPLHKRAIKELMTTSPKTEDFYKNLEFGTGGMQVWV